MDVRLAGVLVHLVLCRNFLDFSYCEARRCAWRWPKAVVYGLYIFGILWTLHLVLIGVYYTYILSGDNSIYVIELYIL